MKILNKFIWSKKEPSNKNDIWFDGSTWKMYTEEAWQSFTLPVDAADKVAKVLENASEVYQEKLNAGYGIIIDGNTISLDKSFVDIELSKKQDKLKSGENIKTINGESLLGGGDIKIEGKNYDAELAELSEELEHTTEVALSMSSTIDRNTAKLTELSAELSEVSAVINGVVQSSITTEGWTLVPLDKPIPQGATITEVVVENGTMPSDTIYVQTSQGADRSFTVSALPFLLTYDIAKMTIGNVKGAKVTLTWESPEGGNLQEQITETRELAESFNDTIVQDQEKLKGLQLLAGKALPYELSGLYTGSVTGGRMVYEANATYNSILFYLPAGFTKFKYDGLVAGSTDGFTNYPKVGDMSEYRASVDKENKVISFVENSNGLFVILDVTLANQPTPFEPTIIIEIAEPQKVGKIINPSAYLRGETLKVLNIGNSYTGNVTSYIEQLASAIGNDVSDLAIYRFYRGSGSFKSWVDIYNGKDTSTYQLSKVVGNLDVGLTPSESAGSNAELFVNALSSVKWDIILIQQASTYATDFDSWNGNGAGGYLSELLNIIRLHQPQATIGYIMPHSYGDNYSSNTEKSSLLRWQKMAEATKSMKSNYGIDFIIPYGTAVESLRATTANADDFTTDGTHLATGLGCYCASCCYYQAILGARYGTTMWGNSLRLPSANNPVTDDNAALAQKAASAALCDMWSITNL